MDGLLGKAFYSKGSLIIVALLKDTKYLPVLVPQSPSELKRAEQTHSVRENVLWVADHFLETPRKWDIVFLKV